VAKSNIKIKLGEDQFAVKSARVSQVMDYLEKRDLKARVIDANLSKKVLVRLQQSP
jgi:cell division protein FtsQ